MSLNSGTCHLAQYVIKKYMLAWLCLVSHLSYVTLLISSVDLFRSYDLNPFSYDIFILPANVFLPEICLNPHKPASVITVIPPKSVLPQWGLPEVSYQFSTR